MKNRNHIIVITLLALHTQSAMSSDLFNSKEVRYGIAALGGAAIGAACVYNYFIGKQINQTSSESSTATPIITSNIPTPPPLPSQENLAKRITTTNATQNPTVISHKNLTPAQNPSLAEEAVKVNTPKRQAQRAAALAELEKRRPTK